MWQTEFKIFLLLLLIIQISYACHLSIKTEFHFRLTTTLPSMISIFKLHLKKNVGSRMFAIEIFVSAFRKIPCFIQEFLA